MNDTKFDVNSLRVASPCSVRWDTMTGSERVRHCDLCQLNVFNTAEMTVADVENLIQSTQGRLCIRMYRRTDGTVLTKDCPAGRWAVRKRVSRLAGAALASVLGLFSISFAQKDDTKKIDASKIKIVRIEKTDDKSRLTGTVVDENGAVIPAAVITLSSEKTTITCPSDSAGVFVMQGLDGGPYKIEIVASGFEKFKVKDLQVREREAVDLTITLKVGHGGEMVGIVSDILPIIDMSSTSITNVIIRRRP